MTPLILMIAALSDTPEKHVLVVCNRKNQDSVNLAEYYRDRRGLSREQVVYLDVSQSENIGSDEYSLFVEKPVHKAVNQSASRIDYIVTTKGVPLKVGVDDPADITQGLSLDAMLAQMDRTLPPITDLNEPGQLESALNPYFDSDSHFSSAKFGMYLVTRLDGETEEDCMGLVESSLGAKPKKGPFYFDFDPLKETPGYLEVQAVMRTAMTQLSQRGFVTEAEESKAFLTPPNRVMGYVSWGSNDGGYHRNTLRKTTFEAGAIADTFVNTSARTMKPWQSGQSQITDLIRAGVTGVKGYVSEPYSVGLTRTDILFDRYTRGFNLAESFYAATPLARWKDVVIGDPLCNPYKPQN